MIRLELKLKHTKKLTHQVASEVRNHSQLCLEIEVLSEINSKLFSKKIFEQFSIVEHA